MFFSARISLTNPYLSWYTNAMKNKGDTTVKKLLVIDGNSILNRAFYGIRPLTNKDGLYTNAIYGMITIIMRHVEALKPDYCAVAFDLKAPTFRHNMYDLYKANRTGMPEELAVQLPYAKECMTHLGFSVLSMEGYEADDILGTLSAEAEREDVQAYVLTGDRDSLQLIGDKTKVLLVKTKETLSVGEDEFREMYGVSSSQFVDVKALMGDSSDNIPGVAGIGEKTALKLISEFGSLDALYEQYEASSLTASMKQKLTNGKENAYLSRTLATINRAVPLETGLADYAYHGPHKKELYDLFVMLEFNALIQKFGLQGGEPAAAIAVSTEQTVSTEQPCVELSAEDAQKQLADRRVAVHFEGEELYFFDGHLLGFVTVTEENASDMESLLKTVNILCFDSKTLYKNLEARNIHIRACAFDAMLAAYVLDSSRSSTDLDEVCVRYLGDSLLKGRPTVTALWPLASALEKAIVDAHHEFLLYDMEMPLAAVLADMELCGFRIDVDGIVRYGEVLKETAEALQSRIYSYAGEEFNISSPKQLGEILFDKMCLPKSRKTKTGYSTDAEVLQKLIPYHPIIEDILDYRQMTKLKSTYADGLAKAADAEGRVHSIFHQTGTVTGRLSSSDPNLQNIPIRTEYGREFRRYFIPKNEDYVIVDADYSQIELRLMAHVAGDEAMLEAYREGTDIHTMTACKVFHVSPDEVTLELRKRAKAVNFGIIYGIGEYSLSEDLGISRAKAKEYIDSYFAGFPQVAAYLASIKEQAKRDGFVTTHFGRKRYIPELSSSNKNLQHFGERVAMNSPIQGTAADIMKLAIVLVDRELKKRGLDARLILQVHDELLLEAHRDCADEAMALLRDCMENAVSLSVPLSVEAHIGKTWFGAK